MGLDGPPPSRRGRNLEAVMLKARAFFYVSAGLLCLALAYNLGARSARAAQSVVTAQSFELQDAEGHVRAQLSADDGRPSLQLFDRTGKKVYLGFTTDGSHILTYRSAMDSVLMILSSSQGWPGPGTSLLLCDVNGTPRACNVCPTTEHVAPNRRRQ